ncbi:MAG: trigger factor [Omnitrophica bacterium]|nr:trigger factor [Candidatus Omnitrophota bacterium]
MKSRIKNTEECSKLFTIEISRELVNNAVSEVYKNIRKVARIPGFRVGFAPQDLLERRYSKEAEEDVLKKLIPEGYRTAVETHKINPIGMPRIVNINFSLNKPLTFEAHVDTRPNVKLRNYKGARIAKRRISVSPGEVDETVSKLRNMHAEYVDVDRPIAKGDYAVCDVEAFADGKPISKATKNMWIQADKAVSLLGMGEELIGLTKGQSKEVEARLPGDYPDKKYAGKLAKFKILVNNVKEKRLPALDDALAGKLNAKNVDALKKEIESQLFARKEEALKIEMKNQILERLLKDNRFSVPSSLVRRQKEIFRERFEAELGQRGLHKDEAEKKVKELGQKLEEDAKSKVRIYFILDDISIKEKIGVGQNDIDARIEAIALSTGRPAEEVKSYYEKENLLGGLAEEIKETKVLDFLLEHAEIIENKP